MKILLTGGGSGGHFYPLIAVAEEINAVVKEENLIEAEIFFISDSPYDAEALAQNNIIFIQNPAGKIRRYFSILNFFDFFKTIWGTISCIIKVFNLYPDVIFSKGAGASFPVLFSAKILRIPLVIHESDSVPGKTNLWAGKFAKKIAISYPETAKYFDKTKTAYTGNPIRESIQNVSVAGSREILGLTEKIPTILVLGGSLGAQIINDAIIQILPKLVEKYYVIHQTGKSNISEVIKITDVILTDSKFKDRYRPFDYLNDLNLSVASSSSNLIISRAGSTIFEIANWGIPSIIIPITNSNGDHQRENAYNYARSGGAIVMEEANLEPNILLSEINRLLENQNLLEKMSKGAKSFSKNDSAEIIAKEIINIGLSHER
ncbi:MAG: UDP-N-acetylglucosamine--N-acetylmuramyl-(pentapeptide) pyrophosphoryl-undecaprenol N-acetylglucosamine transferase [Minisyncoccia bacterium]